MAGYGLIEHAVYGHTVDVFAADTDADDAAGKHIDDHKDPAAAKLYRLATKQVHVPEAVHGLREESEPGRTRGARKIWTAMLREDPAHDVLINLHTEGVSDLLSNALMAESSIDQRLVESQQRRRLENCGELRDSSEAGRVDGNGG